MAATARLELRIDPDDKDLIERAAALCGTSVSRFVAGSVVSRAREILDGGARARAPRPVGGWSFALPDGWDAPLDDLADYR
jgi:hypothetical protein